MFLKIIIIVAVFIVIYFVYQYLYTRNMNNFKTKHKKYIDINAFRKGLLLISLVCVSSFSIYSLAQVNANQNEDLFIWEGYVSVYDQMTFRDERILEIYTNFNLYFGGMYLDDSSTILLIRNDIPQDGINYLESTNLEYQLVKYNYHELLSARIQIEKILYHYEGLASIATDEINNRVHVEVIIGTILPDDLSGFIESDILQVSEVDHYVVAT